MPIAPSARYKASAANPRLLPSSKPTSSTPKFCTVSGTGVNGSGIVIRAHNATNKLAPTTMATCRAASKPRVCVLNVCIATFAMEESPNLQRGASVLGVARLPLPLYFTAKSLLRGVCGQQVAAQSHVQGDRHAHYDQCAHAQDQEPPDHSHN